MAESQRLLELALKGLEADRARIDDEIAEIKRELTNGLGAVTVAIQGRSTATGKKKRTMSAEAKRKIQRL